MGLCCSSKSCWKQTKIIGGAMFQLSKSSLKHFATSIKDELIEKFLGEDAVEIINNVEGGVEAVKNALRKKHKDSAKKDGIEKQSDETEGIKNQYISGILSLLTKSVDFGATKSGLANDKSGKDYINKVKEILTQAAKELDEEIGREEENTMMAQEDINVYTDIIIKPSGITIKLTAEEMRDGVWV